MFIVHDFAPLYKYFMCVYKVYRITKLDRLNRHPVDVKTHHTNLSLIHKIYSETGPPVSVQTV